MMRTVVERVLEAVARRCSSAEVYGLQSLKTPVGFEAGSLKSIESSEFRGIALRVIHEGRMGFSTTSKLDDVEGLIQNALETARFGQEAQFDFARPQAHLSVETWDPRVGGLGTDDMLGLGQTMVDRVAEYDPKIQTGASVGRYLQKIALANTRGLVSDFSRTSFSLQCEGELVDGDSVVMAWDLVERGGLGDAKNDALTVADSVVECIKRARRNVTIPSGAYQIIFAPMAMPDVVAPLVAALDGKAVEKGISPWRNMVGAELLDPRVSITDDATQGLLDGSAPFDDEGVPTRRNEFVVDGCLRGFYTDLRTASAIGCEPSGNGVRPALAALPTPGVGSLAIEGGARSSAAIIGSCQRGILVQMTMGAWAGNPYSGEVSGNIALGFLVENGEIVGRVKDCLFSINALQAFKNQLVELSSDRKWVFGQYLPYAVVDGVAISVSE